MKGDYMKKNDSKYIVVNTIEDVVNLIDFNNRIANANLVKQARVNKNLTLTVFLLATYIAVKEYKEYMSR